MTRALLGSLLAGLLVGFSAEAADKKIERLYNSKCSACHGKDGKGQTEKGKKMAVRDMTTAEFQKGTDEDFTKAILEGIKKDKDGVKQEMDAYNEEIKAPEIAALVKLMREFKK